jgi:deoxyribodipyrimidine photo-lyase
MVNEKRIRLLKAGKPSVGPVVYWMSRDQRCEDNWALLYAQELALSLQVPLAVVFCLAPENPDATARLFEFMTQGLRETEERLAKKAIAFYLLSGIPTEVVPRFAAQHQVGTLITDFCPLRVKRAWNRGVAEKLDINFYEVDAHNIVPCWHASPKQEYGAHTFRPKIHRALQEFMTPFPDLAAHPYPWKGELTGSDWTGIWQNHNTDRSVAMVNWLQPGETAARRALHDFLEHRLPSYNELRNDPTKSGQSNLSPYLHFGQLAPQRAALEAGRCGENIKSQEAFLEELVVRRELADNFCLYNDQYDSYEGFPAWARNTLDKHRNDAREYVYSLELFEQAVTHDELWNAAQREMASTGKMHGYMRMYWAKKILEWSESPEQALEIAIYLNDRYALDGHDPNGYTGIAWSTGGVHDRAWVERPVFGKIRYMNYNGCKRKFDVQAYIARYPKHISK